MNHLRCEPMRIFLEGLGCPEAWEQANAELKIGDVIAGLSKTADALNAPAACLAGNLAIIGGDYLNLSMRLGYHFSVIDALLGRDPQRNYVYFRFAGGLADARKRERRARFIYHVLTAMDFNVSQKGDLVVGRLKWAPPICLRQAIRTLGMLTVFMRQRDTALHSDNDARELFGRFAGRFMQPDDDSRKEGELCSSA